jgi:hypothetical protein
MEIEGIIKVVQETIEKGTFKSRNVVISTNEQYPQFISVQFVQDKCSILDNYKVGQEVKIGINLRGRSWTNPEGETVYFNTIQGWKIEKTGEPTKAVEVPTVEEKTDDLPF